MTSYARSQGLLADPYAGAFTPRPAGLQGLLSDPAMMQQLAQKAQAMGLLDGRGGMGNDSVQMPAADPSAPVQMSGPLPGAPAGPMAPGMGGQKPGMMGGAATQTAAPSFPGRQIPSGYAMPISPRASLDSLYGMYAPAASAEGKLPPMGLGGLRRMYASPETLAAEAETAKAKAVEAAPAPVYVPANESGGGDGAAAEGTSNAEGASASADAGNNGVYRRGGMIPSDGDGKLEARKATLHEGEMVMNPEATSLLGPDRLNEINRMALRKKRRGLLDD